MESCTYSSAAKLFVVTLQITVYIGKRDFIDYLTRTDPVGEYGSVTSHCSTSFTLWYDGII